jgi:hypothetical protein
MELQKWQTHLEENDEIRMLEYLDNVDLARQELLNVIGRRTSFRYDLDGYVRHVTLGVCQLDSCVRSMSQSPYDAISVCFKHSLTVDFFPSPTAHVIVFGVLDIAACRTFLIFTRVALQFLDFNPAYYCGQH